MDKPSGLQPPFRPSWPSRFCKDLFSDTTVLNDKVQHVYSGSLASMIKESRSFLPNGTARRGVLTRTPASTSPNSPVGLGVISERREHIRSADIYVASLRREAPVARRVQVVSETARAIHRALESDWARGSSLLSSVRVRALDVNSDDARSLFKFFSLTDFFTTEYFRCSDFNLPRVGVQQRRRLREPVYAAINSFREARVSFLENQGPEQVAQLVAAGEEARRAVLAVTGAEMAGAGQLYYLSLMTIANWFSQGATGPYLILLLSRGVSSVPTKALKWAKKILFPHMPRGPRPFCMIRLTSALSEDHDRYAAVFRAAEREYRLLYAPRKVPSFFSCGLCGKSPRLFERDRSRGQEATGTWETSTSIPPTGQ